MEIKNMFTAEVDDFTKGNYGRAMADVRHRHLMQKLPIYAWRALCTALLIWIFSIPGIAYWTTEILGSMILFSVVYIFMPFFAFAVVLAVLKHWKVILQAIWECAEEAAQYMRFIRR